MSPRMFRGNFSSVMLLNRIHDTDYSDPISFCFLILIKILTMDLKSVRAGMPRNVGVRYADSDHLNQTVYIHVGN
jgi:hypothetical protein